MTRSFSKESAELEEVSLEEVRREHEVEFFEEENLDQIPDFYLPGEKSLNFDQPRPNKSR